MKVEIEVRDADCPGDVYEDKVSFEYDLNAKDDVLVSHRGKKLRIDLDELWLAVKAMKIERKFYLT